jgi:riboflavin transporter FmnP
MRTKARILIFAMAMIITAIVFVLIETLVFHEDLKRSIIGGLIAGIGAATGMMIYLNYLKRKYLKEKNQ